MLPKPPRLLVEPGELVVVPPEEEGERPTTVEGGEPEEGERVVVVSPPRRPPPHHHQPVPDEPYVRLPPLLVPELELEPQRSGDHMPVCGFCRQTDEPVWRNWQASIVG